MKTMNISHFKTHALTILDQIAKTHEEIVITKRGKPLAQVAPYRRLSWGRTKPTHWNKGIIV